jgi:methylated-DNA-[protein]-cysteine S-methyltransferase
LRRPSPNLLQGETIRGLSVFYSGRDEDGSERRMQMNAYVSEIGSPIGPVAFATNEEGALLGLRFRDGRRPASLENGLKREGFALSRDEDRTSAAREQLVEYFAGERRSFDLPVVRRGTDFQDAVWEELSHIPFGETRTYGQVAQAVWWPDEAIEVGSACAANPVLLVVPCHRVVGADGSLKGYAGGLPIKARLLDFEEEKQKALFA